MQKVFSLRFAVVAAALFCFVQAVHAQPDTYSESSVKAAFIYNFFKFIELPKAPSGDVRLCVVAPRERCEALRGVDGKALSDGALRVRELSAESAASGDLDCDALFVSTPDSRATEKILGRAAHRKILTIGEDESFLGAGGAINFYVELGKVRFEVNLAETERVGAKVSSKLLKLGRVHEAKTHTGEP